MDFRDYTHNMETNDFTHNISGAVIYSDSNPSIKKTGVLADIPIEASEGQSYFATDLGYALWAFNSSWVNATGFTIVAGITVESNTVYPSGDTGNRPIGNITGYYYFDTDLGYIITYNGTNWVNATGAIV